MFYELTYFEIYLNSNARDFGNLLIIDPKRGVIKKKYRPGAVFLGMSNQNLKVYKFKIHMYIKS